MKPEPILINIAIPLHLLIFFLLLLNGFIGLELIHAAQLKMELLAQIDHLNENQLNGLPDTLKTQP